MAPKKDTALVADDTLAPVAEPPAPAPPPETEVERLQRENATLRKALAPLADSRFTSDAVRNARRALGLDQ
ncbi:MAG TPA: hypothetical protein VGR28_10645 [Candidatus Thermoplasmatota archaeon]|jgi:hypothetical protein|nr:hypothetical protein [Candidatus Thermoplasmatota archaeon]